MKKVEVAIPTGAWSEDGTPEFGTIVEFEYTTLHELDRLLDERFDEFQVKSCYMDGRPEKEWWAEHWNDDDGYVVEVQYQAGESRFGNEPVDYMFAEVDEIELYAEKKNDTDDETATYEDLKKEIINQAAEKGVDIARLKF